MPLLVDEIIQLFIGQQRQNSTKKATAMTHHNRKYGHAQNSPVFSLPEPPERAKPSTTGIRYGWAVILRSAKGRNYQRLLDGITDLHLIIGVCDEHKNKNSDISTYCTKSHKMLDLKHTTQHSIA